MTALIKDKQSSFERWNYQQFTLKSGTKAFANAAIVLELATAKVVPAAAGQGSGFLYIGTAAETVDATAADKTLQVRLGLEKELDWYENAEGAGEVLATDVGKIVNFLDDATVSKIGTGAQAGRVWAVSATDGVLIEKLQQPVELVAVDAPEFVSNDIAFTSIVKGAVYEIPATGAASTVTLPAAPADGDHCTFVANGTDNGHTVQYRDGTGPTNLTTALTASKRHLVQCVAKGGLWFANAYVSP